MHYKKLPWAIWASPVDCYWNLQINCSPLSQMRRDPLQRSPWIVQPRGVVSSGNQQHKRPAMRCEMWVFLRRSTYYNMVWAHNAWVHNESVIPCSNQYHSLRAPLTQRAVSPEHVSWGQKGHATQDMPLWFGGDKGIKTITVNEILLYAVKGDTEM